MKPKLVNMSVRSTQSYVNFIKFLRNKPWKVGFPRILSSIITPYTLDEVISKNKNEPNN